MKLADILNADDATLAAEFQRLVQRTQMLWSPAITLFVGAIICLLIGAAMGAFSSGPELASGINRIDVPKSLMERLSDTPQATPVAAEPAKNNPDAQALAMLNGWATGSLAKAITLAIFMMGIAMAVAGNSITPAIVSMAMALAMSYGPNILANLFGVPMGAPAPIVAKSDKVQMKDYIYDGNWEAMLSLAQRTGTAAEYAYIAAQLGLIKKDATLLHTGVETLQHEMLNANFAANVLYLAEKTALGRVVSDVAVEFEKKTLQAWTEKQQRAQMTLIAGTIFMGVSVCFLLLHTRMKKRVRRIETMLSEILVGPSEDDLTASVNAA